MNITLLWLRYQWPRLNPVDHLWRGLKNDLAANRQFASMDQQAWYAENWVRTLSPLQTLRKAGLLSKHCWLKKVVSSHAKIGNGKHIEPGRAQKGSG